MFHITSTRAAELLYNFDFLDESFTQPFMRLKLKKDACHYLVSTSEYERRFGVRLRLTLREANDATDWTLSANGGNDLPRKHRRPNNLGATYIFVNYCTKDGRDGPSPRQGRVQAVLFRAQPRQTYMDMAAVGSGAAPASVTAADMPPGGSVTFRASIQYLVD